MKYSLVPQALEFIPDSETVKSAINFKSFWNTSQYGDTVSPPLVSLIDHDLTSGSIQTDNQKMTSLVFCLTFTFWYKPHQF